MYNTVSHVSGTEETLATENTKETEFRSNIGLKNRSQCTRLLPYAGSRESQLTLNPKS